MLTIEQYRSQYRLLRSHCSEGTEEYTAYDHMCINTMNARDIKEARDYTQGCIDNHTGVIAQEIYHTFLQETAPAIDVAVMNATFLNGLKHKIQAITSDLDETGIRTFEPSIEQKQAAHALYTLVEECRFHKIIPSDAHFTNWNPANE